MAYLVLLQIQNSTTTKGLFPMVLPGLKAPGLSNTLKHKARSAARHAALDILSILTRSKTHSRLKQNRVQNLYFHFLPDEDVANFVRLIDTLTEEHTFIPYSEATSRIKSGLIDGRYLSISFDDGFKSNVQAAQILADRGISACFFVCPDMVGKDRKYLEQYFSGDLGTEQRMMTWEEIQYIKDLGHEIGSHTLTHPVLSELPLNEARRQVVDSKAILDARFGSTKHFAWPRGRFFHFSDELADIVVNAGYQTCSSAERGAHLKRATALNICIRRENCVASWPIRHSLYLLGRSIRTGHNNYGQWPIGWQIDRPASSNNDL